MGRTSTSQHKQWRTRAIHHAQSNGQTRCPLCHTPIAWGTHGMPNSPEADHITPVAAGGTTTLDNARVLCRTCNRSLGGKLGRAKQLNQQPQRRKPKRATLTTSHNW